MYVLNIKSRWFVILNTHLSVSARKPKMADLNQLRLHSWLTRTHSQNKCATISSFKWQIKRRGESIFPKIYGFLFKYSML